MGTRGRYAAALALMVAALAGGCGGDAGGDPTSSGGAAASTATSAKATKRTPSPSPGPSELEAGLAEARTAFEKQGVPTSVIECTVRRIRTQLPKVNVRLDTPAAERLSDRIFGSCIADDDEGIDWFRRNLAVEIGGAKTTKDAPADYLACIRTRIAALPASQIREALSKEGAVSTKAVVTRISYRPIAYCSSISSVAPGIAQAMADGLAEEARSFGGTAMRPCLRRYFDKLPAAKLEQAFLGRALRLKSGLAVYQQALAAC
ncbi:hypothetical protein DSM112329_02760 [Paraconexibacter sp. AEG42_29]|uniref:Lipoprotein n=1 Tax=Paraconexibacter sp. AEG42_29 TaxID=2997339 RepID=A0AAU7AW33_9ACTN